MGQGEEGGGEGGGREGGGGGRGGGGDRIKVYLVWHTRNILAFYMCMDSSQPHAVHHPQF